MELFPLMCPIYYQAPWGWTFGSRNVREPMIVLLCHLILRNGYKPGTQSSQQRPGKPVIFATQTKPSKGVFLAHLAEGTFHALILFLLLHLNFPSLFYSLTRYDLLIITLLSVSLTGKQTPCKCSPAPKTALAHSRSSVRIYWTN